MEEELLFLRVIRKGMKTVYTPEIMIFHKEDVSTKTIVKSQRKLKTFVYKHRIRSTKILIEEMENYK